MSTDARRRLVGPVAAGLLALAGDARAQVCDRPQPDRVECRFLNATREAMAVVAEARLHHVKGPVSGAVVLTLDGRTCAVAAARWQLGTGDAQARCVQAGGELRHRVEARLYGVQGARPVDFAVTVQPSVGGLERLPTEADRLAPAPPLRRGWARLWPF